jgi:hypothetical protein
MFVVIPFFVAFKTSIVVDFSIPILSKMQKVKRMAMAHVLTPGTWIFRDYICQQFCCCANPNINHGFVGDEITYWDP